MLKLIDRGLWRSKCNEAAHANELGMPLMCKAAVTPIQTFVGLVDLWVRNGSALCVLYALRYAFLTTHSQRVRASHQTIALKVLSRQ